VTRDALEVWAVQGEQRYSVQIAALAAERCSVTLESEHWPDLQSSGFDLFEAFAGVRASLELLGVVLECNGSRIDVYPSPMLRQATRGRSAYVLSLPRSENKPEVVDIFAAASSGSRFGTVTEQRAWFEAWLPDGQTE